jgi:hypothetical protein
MAMEKNKVKFGLKNVHWAKITGYDEDEMPIYGTVKRLPGAVNLSPSAYAKKARFPIRVSVFGKLTAAIFRQ